MKYILPLLLIIRLQACSQDTNYTIVHRSVYGMEIDDTIREGNTDAFLQPVPDDVYPIFHSDTIPSIDDGILPYRYDMDTLSSMDTIYMDGSKDTLWLNHYKMTFTADSFEAFSAIVVSYEDNGETKLTVEDQAGTAAQFNYKTNKWDADDYDRVINIILKCYLASASSHTSPAESPYLELDILNAQIENYLAANKKSNASKNN